MKQSIVKKLWLTIVGVILVILLVLGLILSQLYQDFYYKQETSRLVKYGENISEILLGKEEISEAELETLGNFIAARVMVVDKAGLVKFCNGMMGMRRGMQLTENEVGKALAGQKVIKVGFNEHMDQTVLSVAVPIKRTEGVIGAVFLLKPVASIEENIYDIQRIIALAAFMSITIATVLSFLLSKTLSNPLISMQYAAHAMAAGNFTAKLEVKNDDEIGLLASSLNNLATKLKFTLEDLHAEKDKLNNVLSSMSDGVITFAKDGKLLMQNVSAQEISPFLNQLTENQDWQEAFKNTNFLKNINKIDWHAGEKDYSIILAPLAGDSGIVAVFHDVTKERNLERLRKDFVANVTHELRTPLSLMQGYAEAVVDFGEDEKLRNKYAQVIMDETKRLSALVNNLLNLAKAEEEINKLNKEEIDAKEFIHQITEEYLPVCKENNLTLLLEIQEGLPVIYADRSKIKQVLINLLDNACRYGNAGQKILVRANKLDKYIKISVIDYGKGIPKEDLPYIWDRFYRVDKSRQRETGGTGLGLAIVKSIVTSHQGQVTVESVLGKFTEFSFTIPLS